MVIIRTPLRISFFGGGTDYPVWYKINSGAVLSTTIDKYCYITCRYFPPFFDMKYLIRYSKREEALTIDEIQHPAVRECLRYLNFRKGVEIVHTSDIPARSGIGSSSSFTVGLLHALHSLKGKLTTKRQLAREAIHVEQNMIKENVGSQDQVVASFGGLNKIEFGSKQDFYVNPVTIDEDRLNLLQSHLMLFYTGLSRNASDIAKEQIKNTYNKKAELCKMREMVDEAIEILSDKNRSITDFGKLLHEAWEIKRCLSNRITTDEINEIYNAAKGAGAVGGKLLGAGGGGFMLFCVPPEQHDNVNKALKNFLHVPFYFENLGSQVIHYATQNI